MPVYGLLGKAGISMITAGIFTGINYSANTPFMKHNLDYLNKNTPSSFNLGHSNYDSNFTFLVFSMAFLQIFCFQRRKLLPSDYVHVGAFARKSTVRSKFLVRLRNLVIFEVFGVKFLAKKEDFSKFLKNEKFHSKNLKNDQTSEPDKNF